MSRVRTPPHASATHTGELSAEQIVLVGRALAENVSKILALYPDAHGFLLRQHGLYTWGADLGKAKRHVEILEFLLETMGRLQSITPERYSADDPKLKKRSQ
jgi:ribulose-5-phosphate 4-epimerase/fuculose-1-phosphate aldolase